MASSSTVTQPNTSLYINNLNDQINKEEMRGQLYALFTTYGKVIDVVASKTPKMRGQAFLVFTDLAAATSALRACDGMLFYDKPLRVQYAKTKSHATLRREDPTFVPPTAAQRSALVDQQTRTSGASTLQKRGREDEMADEEGRAQKRKPADDAESDEGEEMEIDDDEEAGPKAAAANTIVPQVAERPSARLLCTNLPNEVTDSVLSVLFQQYQGFQSTHVVPSPTSNAAGQKAKMAQVLYDAPELATVAKEALDGFTLKKGWVMSVAYA
ncbi:hypothetical protein HETIRDRAFT_472136 [Heterobasidion irregulare TC 32-1]|uniref:RRM domain-containing protein n=1 Tax=Heterobasidion irregulare (strain TC 32-1) TaxID=747525 RepID=W4KDG5_HETIT|nr:uncharacterized protein HETIRDRAFT_472136 [Heterobasidion irregulare TC 32-1]ETW83828.1 hypothetical protein HETIRDRAFT_472136 [Heterobasidion irregulare TC 32-1]